jgi:von Willebrand factor type A domain
MRALPFVSIFGLALAACGPTPGGNGGGDGGGSNGGPDGRPGAADGPAATTDAPDCGSQTEPITVVNNGDPPDLLIVLDRSGSMSGPIPKFPPDFTPKWTIMRDALEQMTSMYEDNIRFGLLEFPTDNDCAVDQGTAVRVDVDLHQASAVASYFSSQSPDGNTPAAQGLAAALTYYQGIPVNTAGQYVLFATDGDPNCSDGDPASETVDAVTALASANVKTYVLGFGGGFVDDSVLNDSAVQGQVPKAGGPPYYYAANSAAELDAVLSQISGGIIVPSCSYTLASTPPDPDNVTVTMGGTAVPRSTMHTDGWDYYPDSMTITFFGSYCDQIQSGAVADVSFVYGCPGPVVN